MLGGLSAWKGRIVIDATNAVAFLDLNSPAAKDPSNPLAAYGSKTIDLGGKYSSEVFSAFVRQVRVVKALNHLDARVLPEQVLRRPAGSVLFGRRRKDRGSQGLSNKLAIFGNLGAHDVSGPLSAVRLACDHPLHQDLTSIKNRSSPSSRAQPDPTLEDTGEVALVGKAAGPSDRIERCASLLKHGLGRFDASLNKPGMWSKTG